MIIDQQDCVCAEGIVAFPDFVFPVLPRQEPIKETIFLDGSDTNSISVTGTLDNPG